MGKLPTKPPVVVLGIVSNAPILIRLPPRGFLLVQIARLTFASYDSSRRLSPLKMEDSMRGHRP